MKKVVVVFFLIIGTLFLISPVLANPPLPTVTVISPTSGSTAGGTVVTITGTGLANATAVNFGITLGTGLTVTSDTSITIISPAGSAGVVDVTVTTPSGTSSISQPADQFTYSPPPVAAFIGSLTSGPAPLQVQFTDTSTNTPTSWFWTFGDGYSSTVKNPLYMYASAGTYTVSLTASNAFGSNTTTKTGYITVNSAATPTPTPTLPTPSFSSSVTSGTAPLTVQFTDTSSNSPTTWNWSFGDGNSSTVQSPLFTYTIPGTWTVSLTETNSYGSNITTKTGYISVSSSTSIPIASFTGSPLSGTAPLTVQFNDTSTGSPTSWLWNFGDGGASREQNPSYTYIGAGSYTVSLTSTNSINGNISTQENYITVSRGITQTQTPVPTLSTPIPTSTPPKVVASFKGTPMSGTAPLIVQFTDSSTGSPISWSWDFGDGGTSSQRNPSYTYTYPGGYTVILTVKNAGGGAVSTKTNYITVNAAPTPSPTSPLTTLGALGVAVMISTLLISRKKH